MATLFLDLSGNCVRVLITEGYRLVDVRTMGTFPEGDGGLKTLLAKCFAATGQKIEHAHLILPDTEVATDVCKLQKMPLGDAEKVLLRQGQAQGAAEKSLRLTEIAGPERQLHCLTESVGRQTIVDYRKAFTDAGICLDTIISPLQAILAAFAPVQQDMQHVEVVFNISSCRITALFLSRDKILHHAQIVLPAVEESSADEPDPIRALKRRQFALLTPLHSIYSHFMQENPELSVDKIWLCGPYPGIAGVAESLVEATELDVVLADQIADFDEGSCAFTALAGVLRTTNDPDHFNFIPVDILNPVKLRPKMLVAAVAGIVVLCMAVLVIFTEKQIINLKRDLGRAQQELALLEVTAPEVKLLVGNLAFLENLEQTQVPFYEIFQELAETLPESLDLKSIRYQHEVEKSTFELVAVADFGTLGGSADVFTALAGVLDRSRYLASYSDPIIEVLSAGDAKLIQISITCTLAPVGGLAR